MHNKDMILLCKKKHFAGNAIAEGQKKLPGASLNDEIDLREAKVMAKSKFK